MIWFLFELTDRDICALGANSTGIDLARHNAKSELSWIVRAGSRRNVQWGLQIGTSQLELIFNVI